MSLTTCKKVVLPDTPLVIQKKAIKKAGSVLKETFTEFLDNNSFQKGAALAYYTIFALPPILVLMINMASAIFERDAITGEIYRQIKGMVGAETAISVQEMVENIGRSTNFSLATLVGIGTLLIGATGMFVSLQESLNQIWGVKPKPRNEYLKLFLDRLLSFAMILSIVFLLLVSLIVHAILVAVADMLLAQLEGLQTEVAYLINLVVSFIGVSIAFAAIYKFLPDAKIRWSDVWIGAMVTSLLFTLGKELIGFYLGSSNMFSLYGAAGSIVIILTWVFYTSQILFFGAVFTLVYSRKYGSNIYPAEYAVRVVHEEVEIGKAALNDPDDKPLHKKEE